MFIPVVLNIRKFQIIFIYSINFFFLNKKIFISIWMVYCSTKMGWTLAVHYFYYSQLLWLMLFFEKRSFFASRYLKIATVQARKT